MDFIRIWTEVDISDIENQIIIVDDKYGFCPGCREMGIKLENLKKCPKCEREFKYATSRETKREIEILGSIGENKAKIVRFKLPTPKTCDTLSRMIGSHVFQPAAIFVNGKLKLDLSETELSPEAVVVGSILTDDLKRLNRLFTGRKT